MPRHPKGSWPATGVAALKRFFSPSRQSNARPLRIGIGGGELIGVGVGVGVGVKVSGEGQGSCAKIELSPAVRCKNPILFGSGIMRQDRCKNPILFPQLGWAIR